MATNESVTISLERYNDYLFYKRKYDQLEDVHNSLIEILEDEEFDLENPIHKKIYKIYERLKQEE